MSRTFVAIKNFKYNNKKVKRGDEITPQGGNWDEFLFDPKNRYVTTADVHSCVCGRTFDTPQGLGTHKRFCKEGGKQ